MPTKKKNKNKSSSTHQQDDNDKVEIISPMNKSPKSRRQIQRGINITKNFGFDFANDNHSNTLHQGTTYKGEIVQTYPYSFVVSTENGFRVTVFSQRFEATRNRPDVPVTCFVAQGDTVFVTVQQKKDSKYEEWVAVECWQEPNMGQSTPQRVLQPVNVVNEGMGSISKVMASCVYIKKLTDVIIACRDCTFLYGFQLAKIELTEIFKNGDELTFELDNLPTKGTDGMIYARRAWYGSMCHDDKRGPTDQQELLCMDFCLKRAKLEVYRLLNSSLKKQVTTHIEEELSEDEIDLEYIEPSKRPKILCQKVEITKKTQVKLLTAGLAGCHLKTIQEPANNIETGRNKGNQNRTKQTPVANKNLSKVTGKSPPSVENMKCVEVACGNGNETLKKTLVKNILEERNILHSFSPVLSKVDLGLCGKTVDVATQTYATGELFSFFSIAHIE